MPPSIVLRSSADWDVWYNYIKAVINNYDVVDLVRNKRIPQEPEMPDPDTAFEDKPPARWTDKEFRLFSQKERRYEWLERKYIAQKQGLSAVRTAIQETIDPTWQYLLADTNNVGQVLETIRNELKPNPLATIRDIENRWETLSRGWRGTESMETWLAEWSKVHKRGAKEGLQGFVNPKDRKILFTFLRAIEPLDPLFQRQLVHSINRED